MRTLKWTHQLGILTTNSLLYSPG